MSKPHSPREIDLQPSRLSRLIYAADKTSGSTRQDHGFVFQSGVSNLLGLWVPTGYTDKWDSFDSSPANNPSAMPYSFKNVGINNNVELGSLARQTSITQDFYIYIGFWQEKKLNIKKIYVMKIPAVYWRSLWPNDVTPFLEEQVFYGITNSYSDDQKWKTRRTELTKKWHKLLPIGSPMNWHAKRDHKKQMRIQCSIGKKGFQDLFNFTYDEEKTKELEDALDRT